MDSAKEDRSFSAKLLLFGEHVLLLGAPALAVPVAAFGGHWHWSAQRDRHHARLRQFAESEVLSSIQTLDNKQFVRDLDAGLCFQSNICIFDMGGTIGSIKGVQGPTWTFACSSN